ncbi:hypothetical protein, partial [Klebsiella pneumoniae]|uniref:hypothetical protein n=1 Tax=Klebsiella pneumoniae TaxID=573 RepID=UPI00195360A7
PDRSEGLCGFRQRLREITAAMEFKPSNLKAAFWMSGSLAAILMMAISGREASKELNVFQIMEMRSLIGLAML